MSIALVTDSTCDLPAELVASHCVTVVPLYILFGEESLRQDVDIDTDTFYSRQRSETVLTTTSQPTPADFEAVYRDLLGRGHETIISLQLSADMSGTMRSALAARDAVRSTSPGADIRVIDSRNVSAGLALLVIEAAKMIASGAGADEVEAALAGMIPRVRVVFYVGSLDRLHKGGRIGLAKALLGTILSLKLMLQVKNGVVQPFAKARKKAKLFEQMTGLVAKEPPGPVFAARGDSAEDYEAMITALPEDTRARLVTVRVGAVVGCHTGPAVAGLGFLAS